MAKEDVRKLREELKRVANSDENLYPDMDYAAEWMDLLGEKLRMAMGEAIKQYPKKNDGVMEALLLGIARFTCMFIEKAERDGIKVNYTNSLYDLYMQIMMPTARDVVKQELDEVEKVPSSIMGFGEAITTDLLNTKVSIDAIIDKYFKNSIPASERKNLRAFLTQKRAEAIEHFKKGTN